MAELFIDTQMVEAAVLGGAVLGGGGGGSMERGRELGELALSMGDLRLIEIDDVAPDALLVTASAVGAPAALEAVVKPVAYVRAVEILMEKGGIRAEGLITNECGGAAVVNGWLQAAVLGIPVIDAPCNGRAHPTGAMGSMGLHAVPGYVSLQAAVGGDAASGRYLEVFFQGGLEQGAGIIRQAAVQAGGLVAVARNPIEASYVKKNGAPGAIRMAIELGQGMLAARNRGGQAVVNAVVDILGGKVISEGRAKELKLETTGGFDAGKVVIDDLELTFWNEYMTLEKDGERLGTFPDLIMTLDGETGWPVTSAEIKKEQRIAVILVERDKLLLGAGMNFPELMKPAEKVIGKAIV